MMKFAFYLVLFFSWTSTYAQTFLNGDFEINSANVCQLNLQNASFNSQISYCTAFGIGSEVDIQNQSCGFATPYSGNWFLSLAASTIGSYDAISLILSTSIIAGNNYQFSFYDQANTQYCSTTDSILIGVSATPISFGSKIYSSLPNVGTWTQRIVNFKAPISGNYITIKNNGTLVSWNFIDNFSFCIAPVFDIGKDTAICHDQKLTLIANTPSASFLWQDNTTNSTYTVTQEGVYWVKVTSNNCSSSDTIRVDLRDCENSLLMPNVFTSKSDGINDFFRPIKYNGIDHATLVIYNRWGQKLIETNNVLEGWDGKYNNKVCADGTYFWTIDYKTITNESIFLKGFVMLINK